MIIVFSLVANRQNRDRFMVVDLEQSNITSGAKWDD